MVGMTLSIPSGKFRIRFISDENEDTGDGFLFNFFDCGEGYVPFKSSCICDVNRFMNYRNDCVPCQPGFYQPKQNQFECLPLNAVKESRRMMLASQQGTMLQVSASLPPLLHASGVSVNGVIFVIGGMLSLKTNEKGAVIYNPMSHAFQTNMRVSGWSKVELSGQTPLPRSQFCIVGMDSGAILIGGKTESEDLHTYKLDTEAKKWIQKGISAVQTSGSLCVRQGDSIIVHGGVFGDGKISGETWSYNEAKDEWSLLSRNEATKRAFTTGGIHNGRLYLFGGSDGFEEVHHLQYFDIAQKQWSGPISVKLDKCIPCDDEKGVCQFGRQYSAFGVSGAELHIYGGLKKSAVLQDIIVLNLESAEIVSRQNYGYYSPDFPLMHPPPKYGSGFVSQDTGLTTIGGAMSLSVIGSSAWVWNYDLRTWSDSSIAYSPIERRESAISKFGEMSFFVFGGSTQYFDEVLLNDLWQFDVETGAWKLIFRETNTPDAPSGRASAAIGIFEKKVSVLGGRTSVREEDKRIWTFDMETRKWTSAVVYLDSDWKRPLNRVGINAAQIASKLWIWGGQLAPGLRNYESYVSIFDTQLESGKIRARLSPSSDPPSRKYGSMIALDEKKVIMFGGVDFIGNVLDDSWILDSDSLNWVPVKLNSAEDQALALSQSAGVSVGNHSLIFGGLTQERLFHSKVQIIQQETQTVSPGFVEKAVLGYSLIFGHSAVSINQTMTMFGGTDGSTLTNQVVSYKPGFCSSFHLSVESENRKKIFDDGSGVSNYLLGSRCSWRIENATDLIISHKMRSIDRISVYKLAANSKENGALVYTSTGVSDGSVTVQNTDGGFSVDFESQGEQGTLETCRDCEGFSIYHAICPKESTLSKDSDGCVCNVGLRFDERTNSCQQEISDQGSGSPVLAIALGFSLGTVTTVSLIFFYLYRRKMIANIEGAEKKLISEIAENEIVFGEIIGSGAFGDVYKGQWRGTDVAIKRLRSGFVKKQDLDSFKQEISTMVGLRHPNILLYMGACMNPASLCLVCEFMTNGSLYDLLHDKNSEISEEEKVQFMVDIAKGMSYLHSSNPPILHHDLKSLNILIDDRGKGKISDFGLSHLQNNQTAAAGAGSLLWLAPEVILGQKYTSSADVYSFGIIMWEILERKEPFEGITPVSVAYMVSKGERPKLRIKVEPSLLKLMNDCWGAGPNMRPNFSEISTILVQSEKSIRSSFSSRKTKQSYEAPKMGPNAAVVCSRIFGFEAILDSMANEEEVQAIIELYSDELEKTVKTMNGLILTSQSDSFVSIFSSVQTAIEFSLEIQRSMSEEKWMEQYKDLISKITPESPVKGLALQIGIGFGENSMESKGRGWGVTGKAFERAMFLCHSCPAGSLLADKDVLEKIKLDKISIPHATKELTIESDSDAPAAVIEISLSSSRIQIDKEQDSGLNSLDKQILLQKDPKKSKASWSIESSELRLSEKSLGFGSFAVVYEGEYKGQKVAVKKIARKSKSTKDILSFMAEVNIMKKVKHAHVAEFLGFCTEESGFLIVMELVNPGSLQTLLQTRRGSINSQQRTSIVEGIVQGMVYLHSFRPPILHRDLKPSNILVNDSWQAKICDFGLSRVKSNNRTMTKCGTLAYQAPEVLKGERYDERADVYSFGIILWQIYVEEEPYKEAKSSLIHQDVIDGNRPPKHKSIPTETWNVITKCWSSDIADRPQFKDLVELLGIVETFT
eukprot:TRINITY_DN2522_c0_g1_i4.p1 TRINITY_DN2522_c0_g1~~TRINITY_DN2522_c0_g1_i4.p1  ORF type:complete len:1709 (-),score=377.78 TRINITY_DN2522_c0_g1_i4:217-5343(-)